MEFRIIKAPSQGAIDILMRRKGSARTETPPCMEAVGVTVEDIRGSCPQNMILLAIFGDTASVESALRDIKNKAEEGMDIC